MAANLAEGSVAPAAPKPHGPFGLPSCPELYLAAFGVFFCAVYTISTTAKNITIEGLTVWTICEYVADGAVGLAVVAALFFPARTYRRRQLPIVLAILTVAFLTRILGGHKELFWLVSMVVCARGVKFDSIVKVYLCLLVPAMLITAALAQAGLIQSLVFEANGNARQAFGSIYPTDFAARLLYGALALTYLRRDKLSVVDVGIACALAAFCHLACRARSATICLGLLALVILYVIIRRRRGQGRWRLSLPGLLGIVAVGLVCCVGVIVLSWAYDPNNALTETVNKLLTTRLYQGHLAFENYDVTALGQVISANGYGGGDAPAEYFYLDSWYMQALFYYGYVGLVTGMLIALATTLRSRYKGHSVLPLIMLVIFVHCITDQFMTNLSYDVFMLALLAELGPPTRPLMGPLDLDAL